MALLATLNSIASLVAASTTENHVILNSDGYTVKHTGLDAAGSASTGPVILQRDASITATMAAADGKIALISGEEMDIPSEWRTLYFRTGSGSPMLSIRPKKGNLLV